jgi:hypothetical protein
LSAAWVASSAAANAAAKTAAWAAAETAARSEVLSAAWAAAEIAEETAAWAAALYAASEKLAPTLASLQESAIALVERMIAVQPEEP